MRPLTTSQGLLMLVDNRRGPWRRVSPAPSLTCPTATEEDGGWHPRSEVHWVQKEGKTIRLCTAGEVFLRHQPGCPFTRSLLVAWPCAVSTGTLKGRHSQHQGSGAKKRHVPSLRREISSSP